MGTRRPTLREIAARLGLADHKSVRHHRDRGMPVDSLDAAADWYARNVSGALNQSDRLLYAGIAFADSVQAIIAELPLTVDQHDRLLVDIIDAWRCATGSNGLGWQNELFDAAGLAGLRKRILDADIED